MVIPKSFPQVSHRLSASVPCSGTDTYSVTFYLIRNTLSWSSSNDAFTYKLKENPVVGQVHLWRLQFHFNKRNDTNTDIVWRQFYNSDSGFRLVASENIPRGLTDGYFFLLFQTIADNNSLDSSNGYQVGIYHSNTSDSGMVVNLGSILRTSLAVEIE